MSLACLEHIISIPGCGNEESLSGYSITDLTGISIKQSANVATEKHVSGLNLLRDVRRRAYMAVRNDVITFLKGNGYIANSTTSAWSTMELRDGSIEAATSAGDYRGIVIKKTQRGSVLHKMHIPYVMVKAAHTGTLLLRVEDGENAITYPFESVSGSISKVKINYTAESDVVYLLLPDTIDVYSVKPNCSCGGSSTPKSKYFTTKGYYNGIETKQEGFGIWTDVVGKCEYDYLLCYLATDGLLGEIVMYKAGVFIMDEQIKSDRFNYYTVYDKEQAAQTGQEWENHYRERFNTLVQSLPKILPNIDPLCIDCRSRRIANV